MDWSMWPAYWGLIVTGTRYIWSFRDYRPPGIRPQLRRIGSDLYFMGLTLWGIVIVKSSDSNFHNIFGSKIEPRVIILALVIVGGYILLELKRLLTIVKN